MPSHQYGHLNQTAILRLSRGLQNPSIIRGLINKQKLFIHLEGNSVMTHMLCHNRVADFAKWKQTFDSHVHNHGKAGLKLVYLWRKLEDQNNVFFLFEVSDIGKAKAFISSPEAAETGKASGVVGGEYHFVESIPNSQE